MDRDERQQKPKPKAKAKQMASHSYLTRSKDKRTSHSDDDRSGSESHQPPFSKSMRLGTKQAEEAVGIINDEMTPDSNAMDTNAVDEYALAETALQNDVVLKTLCSYLNWSDLLSCRVVNKQWQDEATKELRRRKLVIKFSFRRNGNQLRQNIAFQNICRLLRECRTPSLLSSFQVKMDAFNDLGSAGVRNIFNTVGNKMKHLTLHLSYSMHWSCFEKRSLMTHLQNLLYRQALSLEFLEIKFDLCVGWTDNWHAFGSSDHHQNNNNVLLLPNLNTFIVSGTPPPKFFADVINAAVNLRAFGGDWSTWNKYLMGAEGEAKIHQLKNLQLSAHSSLGWQKNDVELMEAFLAEHIQNLKLETFYCASRLHHESSVFAPRINNVINQILECSSESLQKVMIEPGRWFTKRFIIPRLPKLQEISYDCVSSEVVGEGFFPRGFNANTSFPNISSIVLLRWTDVLFRQFAYRHRMGIVMTEPVPSIRYITLVDEGKHGRFTIYDPPLPTVTDFRHVFPNLVSISYVDSDYYYKI